MNEIKILNLSLRNFKGIKEFNLPTAGGNDVNILGENGTGKTTIMDAFIWLLFDKDSANISNFNIKTLDEDGNPLHGLEHEVIANLLINNKEIELQKIYKENWVKRKGQSEEELSGHTKNYFINGVPKKQKEYNEYLGNIVKEENFKILTNPLYFNTALSWKERRSIILDLEKDITDLDVFKEDKDLLPLQELMEDKSVDDLKKEMTARRRKLNEELESIPHRIDELSRNTETIDIETLNKEKKELEEKLATIKNLDAKNYDFYIRGLNGSIKTLESEMKDLERSETEELREKLEGHRKYKFEQEKQLSELQSKELKLDKGVITLEQSISSLNIDIEGLREKFKDIKAKEFKKEETVCPTCNRELEPEKIEQLVKDFEENKQKELSDINILGKENKSHLEKHKKELDEKQNELLDTKEEIEATEFMLKGKNNVIEKLEKEIENINIEKLPQYKENKTKIEELEEEKIKVLENQKNQEDKASSIKEIENKILDIDKDLAKEDLVKENENRKEELMERETELAQIVADAERIEFLCDEYTVTKSSLLEDKLNDKFDLVKFKLFNKQVNGGIDETFVTTVEGVPFDDLNNAMKIQAGLDIITTLSQQHELTAPIFIDNRESINEIPDMDNQVISLIVSKHKNLRTEVQ